VLCFIDPDRGYFQASIPWAALQFLPFLLDHPCTAWGTTSTDAEGDVSYECPTAISNKQIDIQKQRLSLTQEKQKGDRGSVLTIGIHKHFCQSIT
jgi:hypothetical protein